MRSRGGRAWEGRWKRIDGVELVVGLMRIECARAAASPDAGAVARGIAFAVDGEDLLSLGRHGEVVLVDTSAGGELA
jgi:hypothetical protein